METIHPDWKELLELLNSNSVKYVVVGGHALAFHGLPRFTSDLDCFILADRGNAANVQKALIEFGYGSADFSIGDLEKPSKIFMLGIAPYRIDLITKIDGVSFDEAYDTAVNGHLGSVPVKFISREKFIKNKRASGRTKDLADIEALENQDSD